MTTNRAAGQGTRFRPTRETKISDLLKAYPNMIEVLARYNKHFELLRRPTLRKLMTPLVTIEKAARTAQVDADEMLAEIYRVIGETLPPGPSGSKPALQPAGTPMPEELRSLPLERQVILDVREDVRAGDEPYHRIMKAVASLRADQVLRLCNIFEPVPLYDILAQRGLSYWTERRGPEEWWVTFYRPAAPIEGTPADGSPVGPRVTADDSLIVDARGLEPPHPMAKILESLSRIETGGQILARTDRRPMLLYPKLEDRGFKYTTAENADGWFETRIWK